MTYKATKTIYTNFEGEVVPADSPEASHKAYEAGMDVPEDEIEQYKKMSRKLPAVHEGGGEDDAEPKEDASQPMPSTGTPAHVTATPTTPHPDAGGTFTIGGHLSPSGTTTTGGSEGVV